MAKVRVNLSAPEAEALRKATTEVKAWVDRFDQATPAELAAFIEGMTAADQRRLLLVLALKLRALERR